MCLVGGTGGVSTGWLVLVEDDGDDGAWGLRHLTRGERINIGLTIREIISGLISDPLIVIGGAGNAGRLVSVSPLLRVEAAVGARVPVAGLAGRVHEAHGHESAFRILVAGGLRTGHAFVVRVGHGLVDGAVRFGAVHRLHTRGLHRGLHVLTGRGAEGVLVHPARFVLRHRRRHHRCLCRCRTRRRHRPRTRRRPACTGSPRRPSRPERLCPISCSCWWNPMFLLLSEISACRFIPRLCGPGMGRRGMHPTFPSCRRGRTGARPSFKTTMVRTGNGAPCLQVFRVTKCPRDRKAPSEWTGPCEKKQRKRIIR